MSKRKLRCPNCKHVATYSIPEPERDHSAAWLALVFIIPAVAYFAMIAWVAR